MGGAHVLEVVKMLSRVVFLLGKLKCHVTEQYLVTAYHGRLLDSNMSHGIIIFFILSHTPRCKDVLKLHKSDIQEITSTEDSLTTTSSYFGDWES